MKIILIFDVKTLGRQGEVVEVSDGYAHHFLFPQSLAVSATAAEIRKLQERTTIEKQRAKKGITEARKLAEKLDGYELVLQEKVNEKGKFYGAVTDKIVAAHLRKVGFVVEDGMIQMPSPLKEPSNIEVLVNLPHGFEATIRLIVESR